MPFRIGLSGLQAAAADLKVTGNNIANTATVGFKESRAEFADVYSQSYAYINKTAIGGGVRLAATTQQFSQGNLEYTQNALDLGINGEGFFVIRQDAGEDAMAYTRNGAFQVDREGYVVNVDGQRLQVYSPKDPNSTDPEFNVGTLSDLRLPLGEDSPPSATTEIKTHLNLRSDAEEPAVTPAAFFPDPADPAAAKVPDPDSYNYSTALTVYDSLGNPRELTMYFVRGEDPLNWDVYVGMVDDAGYIQNASEDSPVPIVFDSNGNLVSVNGNAVPDNPATFNIEFPAGADFEDNGAAPITAVIDLTGTTQYGTKYSVNELSQDGYTTGRLSGFDVDQTGVVFARYTNGQSEMLGQVAMANFQNPQGLQQLGDNNWAESFNSGQPVYDTPGNGRYGAIQSGALEASNVDLAEELVDLITAQRNYQANAQTISTADEITQTIINIR